MNTTALDTVKAFMVALEADEPRQAAKYMADTFVFTGWSPAPLSKNDFLTVMTGLKEAFPNLAYNFEGLHELDMRDQHHIDQLTVKVTGHQENTLNLPPLSLPPVPQMGRSIALPQERWTFTVDGEQIVRIAVERVPGGGIEGLMQQLGVEVRLIQ